MKKVITYGTYDFFHKGHKNLLKRAKELGDYLIVGVTSENYDKNRGKLNVQNSTLKRVEDIKKSGLADEIIIEEYPGQKIDDIQKYDVDIFVLGSDWSGKFDYLNEFCEVVYLERTKGISSTKIRSNKSGIINIGVVGSGRIANRFIPESKFVSGVNIIGVYNPNIESAKEFGKKHELKFYTNNFEDFINNVDAVYIASPHKTHFEYAKKCLESGKHVLCEKPLVLNSSEGRELFKIANDNSLVLMEAIKTAYTPAFQQLISHVKSGLIGNVLDVDATFTKLVSGNLRELSKEQAGGSFTELGSYVLLPIIKLFGTEYNAIQFYSKENNGIDLFTRGLIMYDKGIGSFKVGLGLKSEGQLIISGTKGYAYVPAPWWKTEYFEIRFEDQNRNQKYFSKFDGDGLRYEINDFISLINKQGNNFFKLKREESVCISKIMEEFIGSNSKLML